MKRNLNLLRSVINFKKSILFLLTLFAFSFLTVTVAMEFGGSDFFSNDYVEYRNNENIDFTNLLNSNEETSIDSDSFSNQSIFGFSPQDDYCIPDITLCRGITHFEIQGDDETEISRNYSGCPPNRYGDQTQYSVNLTMGQRYDGLITPEETGQYYLTIWIDFNRDGEFTEDEIVTDATSVSTVFPYFQAQLPETEDVISGMTRMRILFTTKKTNFGEHHDPCGSYTFGLAADYSVNLNAPEICEGEPDAGTAIASKTQGYTGDVVTFTAEDYQEFQLGLRYSWEYKINDDDWEILSNDNAMFLPANKLMYGYTGDTYQARLKVSCLESELSSYSEPATFEFIPPDSYCIPFKSTNPPYLSLLETEGAVEDISYSADSAPTDSYADKTDMIIKVNKGQTFSLNTVYNRKAEYTDQHHLGTWIDWNQNSDFEKDEMTDTFINGSVGVTDITIPEDIAAGEYRIRFGVSRTESYPCFANSGSFIDFTLKVLGDIPECVQTFTFNNADGDGSWNNGNNWDQGSVPGADDCVVIPNGLDTLIIGDGVDASANSITLNNGGQVIIKSGGSLTLEGGVTNNSNAGSFVIEDGGNLIQTHPGAVNSGNITAEKNFTFSAERKQYNFVISPLVGQPIKNIYSGSEYVIEYHEDDNLFYNAGNGDYNEFNPAKGFAIKEGVYTAGNLFEESFGSDITAPNYEWSSSASHENLMEYSFSNTDNAGGEPNELKLRPRSGSSNTSEYSIALYPENSGNKLSLNLSNYEDVKINFKHAVDLFAPELYNVNIALMVSTDPDDLGEAVWKNENISNNIPAESLSIDLSDFEGEPEVYFAFEYSGDTYGLLSGWFIDDIVVTGTIIPNSETIIAEFAGIPYNGDAGFVLSRTGAPEEDFGYNLVGNPYPSNIDLNKLYAANDEFINGEFWFWDNRGNEVTSQQGSDYEGNNYAKFNAVNGTGTAASDASGDPRVPTKYVNVGTAFMVRALPDADGETLEFTNDIRTTDGGPGFLGKGLDSQIDRYWLTMTAPSDITTMTAVVYFEGGSDGYGLDDTDYAEASDEIFTMTGEHKLTIQGRVPFEIEDVVPLGVTGYFDGMYKISLHDSEGVFETGQNIYLRDKQLDILHNLSEEDYEFMLPAGETLDRFEIVYEGDGSMGIDDLLANQIIITKDKDEILIASKTDNLQEVQLYDLQGKMVYNNLKVQGKELRIPSRSLGIRVLVAVVKTVKGDTLSKKIINR